MILDDFNYTDFDSDIVDTSTSTHSQENSSLQRTNIDPKVSQRRAAVHMTQILLALQNSLENFQIDFDSKFSVISSKADEALHKVEHLPKNIENPINIENNTNMLTLQDKLTVIGSIVGLVVAIIGLLLVAFFWGLDAKFSALSSQNSASDVKNEARYESIMTEVKSIHQRLDDQKNYIDAKTEKR